MIAVSARQEAGNWLGRRTYHRTEVLHHRDASVQVHLLHRPQALRCDQVDLEPRVFGHDQIEVVGGREVACARAD